MYKHKDGKIEKRQTETWTDSIKDVGGAVSNKSARSNYKKE